MQSLACFIFCNRFVYNLIVFFAKLITFTFLFFCRFLPVQLARFKWSIVVAICFFLPSGLVMTIMLGNVVRFVVLPLFWWFLFAHFGRLFFLLVLRSFTPSPGVYFAFLGGRCMHMWNTLSNMNAHNPQTPLVFPSLSPHQTHALSELSRWPTHFFEGLTQGVEVTNSFVFRKVELTNSFFFRKVEVTNIKIKKDHEVINGNM